MQENIVEMCRRFRREATPTERRFWKQFRNRQFVGYKFLRQHPISFSWGKETKFFIADFYCHEAKLVIEIDGGIHESQKDYDKLRDRIINYLGYKVIRFSNEEVVNNIDKVLNQLRKYLMKSKINSPSLFKRRGYGDELKIHG